MFGQQRYGNDHVHQPREGQACECDDHIGNGGKIQVGEVTGKGSRFLAISSQLTLAKVYYLTVGKVDQVKHLAPKPDTRKRPMSAVCGVLHGPVTARKVNKPTQVDVAKEKQVGYFHGLLQLWAKTWQPVQMSLSLTGGGPGGPLNLAEQNV